MSDESKFIIPELDETQSTDEQLKQLALLKAKLEYTDLKMSVENELARREQNARNREIQQRGLEQFNKDKAAEQKMCKHKKGGKDLGGILKGNKPERSVITHTFPWGQTFVRCTRCGGEMWQPMAGYPNFAIPSEALNNKGSFDERMLKFKEWLEFETDNEPSGNQIFLIIDNRPKEPEPQPSVLEAAKRQRKSKKAAS